jgi:hypothetical protein
MFVAAVAMQIKPRKARELEDLLFWGAEFAELDPVGTIAWRPLNNVKLRHVTVLFVSEGAVSLSVWMRTALHKTQ